MKKLISILFAVCLFCASGAEAGFWFKHKPRGLNPKAAQELRLVRIDKYMGQFTPAASFDVGDGWKQHLFTSLWNSSSPESREQNMEFGEFELFVVSDGAFRLDGGAMFGTIPKALWERTNPADDRNRIAFVTVVFGGEGSGDQADRDHCLQYMVAVPLIHGRLTADDYEDDVAQNERIDSLRDKMTVRENQQFSANYLNPEKRAIGNAITIRFGDGSSTDRVAVDYPIGHRRRRAEGMPVLRKKFERNLRTHFTEKQADSILSACENPANLISMNISNFMSLWMTTK